MTYALIGCGRIAGKHIQAAINNNLEIAAVCDINPERIDAVLEFIPEESRSFVRRYTDYNTMLSEIAPKLCAIATESGKHAAIALDCIDAGVNVIIEKPIALSLSDADRIIRNSMKKCIKVCACHQNRFNKPIQKLRDAIEMRRFGKMFYATAHIRWNRDKKYYAQADWRGTWEQDGGALMNQCIHNIDLLRWMMGDDIIEIIGVTDRLNHNYLETEDFGLAIIKFANGSYGLIEGTTNIYPANLEETLYIFGEKGTVKIGGKAVNLIEEWKFSDDIDDSNEVKRRYSENPANIYGFGHTRLYADMIDAIINDRQPYVDAYAGKRAVETVLAIYKSQTERKPIKFPLEQFSCQDMSADMWQSNIL